MDAEAIAIDHPDPSIIDFVQKSGLVSRGMSARFGRLPGGVSSDIWLVHAGDRSFCVKRALAQLRVAADWRTPIERNTKEAGWIKAVAGFMPEAVPALLPTAQMPLTVEGAAPAWGKLSTPLPTPGLAQGRTSDTKPASIIRKGGQPSVSRGCSDPARQYGGCGCGRA